MWSFAWRVGCRVDGCGEVVVCVDEVFQAVRDAPLARRQYSKAVVASHG